MTKVSNEKIYPGKKRPKSFYEYITSRFISKPLVPLLIRLGFRNPNTVTVISFIILITASVLILFLQQVKFFNRLFIVLLIEISFVLDSSDGQIARVMNKTSSFGAWLDKYLDRIGEMVLYTIIGYLTWKVYSNVIYFIMGLSIGYLFTYYTIVFSLRDSVFYEELKNQRDENNTENYEKNKDSEALESCNEEEKREKLLGRHFIKNMKISEILSMAFFYLNIGLGERYLYPMFFILINKTNIMLPIVLTLILLRAGNMTLTLSQQIKSNEGPSGT